MSYYSMFQMGLSGGIMVTGSHNPPEYNGFKLSMGKTTIFGDQIQELKKVLESEDFLRGDGTTEAYDISDEYVARYKEEFKDIAYFFRSGAGLRFDISDTAQMYFQYAYATGLALNDNNNSSVTRLTIGVDTIGLGVMVDIPCNKKDEDIPENTDTNELETN